MIEIVEASSPRRIAQVAGLLADFLAWQETRYHGANTVVIEAYFDRAAWDAELADLGRVYGPPAGGLLLALDGERPGERDGARPGQRPAGCVALRPLAAGACEVKRLFVPARYRGRGLAKRLMGRLTGLARRRGYEVTRLDTGDLQHEARALYHTLGFRETAPYSNVPEALGARMVFMELTLQRGPRSLNQLI